MKQISEFISENFQFLVVKLSIYLNSLVFVMRNSGIIGVNHLFYLYNVQISART